MQLLQTATRLAQGQHVTIVAFGDSITEITFHTQGRMNWVGLLSEAILETYGNGMCTMINSGKCGSAYADSMSRLEQDVLRYHPDLVILSFGMNDAGGRAAGIETFERRVRDCVTTIRQRCRSEILIRTPNPVVTVNGLDLPREQPRPGREWETGGRPVRLYAEALVRVGQDLGCPVVDHYTLWTTRAFTARQPVADPNALWPRMSDAIHPGWLGHLVFFRELAPLFGVPSYFPWEDIRSEGDPK